MRPRKKAGVFIQIVGRPRFAARSEIRQVSKAHVTSVAVIAEGYVRSNRAERGRIPDEIVAGHDTSANMPTACSAADRGVDGLIHGRRAVSAMMRLVKR